MFNKLNPNTINTVTKVLCIDSLFRESPNTSESSNFVFRLSEPINNVVSIKLSSIELPNNWFLFAKYDYSNSFMITCYNVPSYDELDNTLIITPEIPHLIEIPEGNYTAENITDVLSNYFANTGRGLQYVGFAVNQYNSKSEFYAGASADKYPFNPYEDPDISFDKKFYFKIDFTIPNMPTYPLLKTVGWTLGFRKYIYVVGYLVTTSQRITESLNHKYLAYLESESSYGSSFFQYVFLDVDDYQKNVASNAIVSYNGDCNLSNNILAKIVISGGHFTNINDNGSDFMFKRRNYFGPIKLEKLHIKLLSRYGDVINLNGNSYSFTLELEVLYS